mmetsp:Transcript_7124/g.20149  ORF Transcript_7124/g.20149 Transcript_7124/m.20149 type:complete len:202 (-) Transcript_7124:979-1584(-)
MCRLHVSRLVGDVIGAHRIGIRSLQGVRHEQRLGSRSCPGWHRHLQSSSTLRSKALRSATVQSTGHACSNSRNACGCAALDLRLGEVDFLASELKHHRQRVFHTILFRILPLDSRCIVKRCDLVKVCSLPAGLTHLQNRSVQHVLISIRCSLDDNVGSPQLHHHRQGRLHLLLPTSPLCSSHGTDLTAKAEVVHPPTKVHL